MSVCVCVGGAGGLPFFPSSSESVSKKDNNDEFVRHHSSCSVYSGRVRQLIEVEHLNSAEFFSSLKIRCLTNDIRGGTHGAALCGLSAGGVWGVKNTMRSIP